MVLFDSYEKRQEAVRNKIEIKGETLTWFFQDEGRRNKYNGNR